MHSQHGNILFPHWEEFIPMAGMFLRAGSKLLFANKARVLSDRGRLLKNNDWLLKIPHLPLQPSQSPYLWASWKIHHPLYLPLHLPH